LFTRDSLRTSGIRTFLIIWSGQVVSSVGSGLTSFALSIWIYERTDSVSLLALNLLALALPGIIFSPLAGVLADRYNRRLILIAADLIAGASTAIVFWLILTDQLDLLWPIYLSSFIRSAATAFQWPAYLATVPLLVPKDNLERAGGLSQAGDALNYLIGPVLAGLLYVMPGFGFAGIVGIDLATMLFAVLALLTVRVPDAPRDPEADAAKSSFREEITYGWRYIRSRKGLLGLLIYYALVNFFQEFTTPLVQPLLLNLAPPNIVGLCLSITALGFVVGIGLITVWGGPKRRVPAILLGTLGLGIGLAIVGLRPSLILITVGGFIYFTLWPIIDTINNALWQLKCSPAVQGRVFATRNTLTYSMRPLAYVLAGPLVDRVFEPLMRPGGALASSVGQVLGVGHGRGIGLILVVIGVLTAITTLIAWLNPHIRGIQSDLPDAIGEIPVTASLSAD
jgi:MFS transporter, DHA3 family, macrolide efflux protein